MSYADEVLELRNRVRFAAAQSQWDNASEPEPESDDIASRRLGIELAREELAKAERLLDAGNVLLADQRLADAANWILQP